MLKDDIRAFKKDYKGIPKKYYKDSLVYSILRFRMELVKFFREFGKALIEESSIFACLYCFILGMAAMLFILEH